MNDQSVICPICKYGQAIREYRFDQSMVSYQCPLCGTYEIPVHMREVRLEKPLNHKLSLGYASETNGESRSDSRTGRRLRASSPVFPTTRPSRSR
jgi:predicted RNA-binding Zn-ribbon protein involved in translation (DUF1610 family)